MRVHIIIVGLFGIFEFSSCGNHHDEPNIPITPESFTQYTEVPGYLFNAPISVAIDSPFVFIADEKDSEVVVLDWNFTFLFTIGREGEGPGEFKHISDIDARNGLLAVADGGRDLGKSGRNVIHLFNYSGEFINQIPAISTTPPKIHITEQMSIVWMGFLKTNEHLLYSFSTDGSVISRHVTRPDLTTYFSSECAGDFVMQEDEVFIAFTYRPKIIGGEANPITWIYDQVYSFPQIADRIRAAEEIRSPMFFVRTVYQGGLIKIDQYLIVAASNYNIMIIDINTSQMYPISTGSLGEELLLSGRRTFEDIAIKGNDLIFISRNNSMILTVPIARILECVGKCEGQLPVSIQ